MSIGWLGHAVGYATVAVLCLTTSAQALPGINTVDSGDIKNGQVRTPDIAANAVNGVRVVDNSLGGADVNERALSVPNMGCQRGLAKGWATIQGYYTIPATYTTDPTYIHSSFNCGGPAARVLRTGSGNFQVSFPNSGAAVAVGNAAKDAWPGDVAVSRIGADTFQVIVSTDSQSTTDDYNFNLVVY